MAQRESILIGIVGLAIAAASLGYAIYSNQPKKPLVSKSSRFYCAYSADPNKGGRTWTVMYRHDRETQPWLRMVRAMGDDWDPKSRCEEIARRLDIFRQDGLIAFDYRTHPNTPGQYVLCAKTRISGDNCPLVLTLMYEDDPYEELREVAGALLPGSLPSYQCNNAGLNCPPPKPVLIGLEEQLAEGDRWVNCLLFLNSDLITPSRKTRKLLQDHLFADIFILDDNNQLTSYLIITSILG